MKAIGKHKSETGIEALGKATEEITKIADEVVSQRLGKVEPPAENQAVPVADESLRRQAEEFGVDVKRQLGLLLGAIDLLLAGADFLSWDFVKALQDQRDSLSGGMQSQTWEQEAAEDAEEEAREAGEEPTEEYPVSDSDIADIEKRLSIWQPVKQAAILRKVAERMPEKMREYEVETARDKARDEFLNYLGQHRSYGDETVIYEQALAAVKAGNGIMELKATA